MAYIFCHGFFGYFSGLVSLSGIIQREPFLDPVLTMVRSRRATMPTKPTTDSKLLVTASYNFGKDSTTWTETLGNQPDARGHAPSLQLQMQLLPAVFEAQVVNTPPIRFQRGAEAGDPIVL
jgi:hypothetical protein